MNRVFKTFAISAAAVGALALPLGSVAFAQSHHGGGGYGHRDRGYYRGGAYYGGYYGGQAYYPPGYYCDPYNPYPSPACSYDYDY